MDISHKPLIDRKIRITFNSYNRQNTSLNNTNTFEFFLHLGLNKIYESWNFVILAFWWFNTIILSQKINSQNFQNFPSHLSSRLFNSQIDKNSLDYDDFVKPQNSFPLDHEEELLSTNIAAIDHELLGFKHNDLIENRGSSPKFYRKNSKSNDNLPQVPSGFSQRM